MAIIGYGGYYFEGQLENGRSFGYRSRKIRGDRYDILVGVGAEKTVQAIEVMSDEEVFFYGQRIMLKDNMVYMVKFTDSKLFSQLSDDLIIYLEVQRT